MKKKHYILVAFLIVFALILFYEYIGTDLPPCAIDAIEFGGLSEEEALLSCELK